jgi:hypothetical protein
LLVALAGGLAGGQEGLQKAGVAGGVEVGAHGFGVGGGGGGEYASGSPAVSRLALAYSLRPWGRKSASRAGVFLAL